MKTMMRSLVCAATAVCAAAYADEPAPQVQPVALEAQYPNHFYFGPEFLGYQLNIHVQDVKVHGNRFFWGLRLGYEYLKPKAFYFGIDLSATGTETDFKASSTGQSLSWHKAERDFGNLDLRFGYTFAPNKWLVTPFAGLGWYDICAIDHYNHQGFREELPYADVGVRTVYAFNRVFNLGLNLRAQRTFNAEQRFKYNGGEVKDYHNMWGGEIAVPFIWHVGAPKKRWDIQLVPYFLKLDFSEVQNIYGTRVLFGYRF